MIEKVKDSIDYLAGKPKMLFLMDSVGALLTAFFLFVVLRSFNEYVGMPMNILTYLSVIAACFFIYSTACYLFLKKNHSSFIKAISVFNILYVVLTLVLILVYYSMLTRIGISYFLIEIMIVCVLAYMERSVAIKLNQGQILVDKNNQPQ